MRTFGILVGLLFTVVVGLFIWIIQPGTSGVVASLRLQDGSEYMVTQQCNWSPEPYTVSFYMRSAGGQWGWCYIDHQADRWSNVCISYNESRDSVNVYKQGKWQASLDRRHSTFSIGDGKPKRELPAPQELRQPNFAFP